MRRVPGFVPFRTVKPYLELEIGKIASKAHYLKSLIYGYWGFTNIAAFVGYCSASPTFKFDSLDEFLEQRKKLQGPLYVSIDKARVESVTTDFDSEKWSEWLMDNVRKRVPERRREEEKFTAEITLAASNGHIIAEYPFSYEKAGHYYQQVNPLTGAQKSNVLQIHRAIYNLGRLEIPHSLYVSNVAHYERIKREERVRRPLVFPGIPKSLRKA